MLENNDFQILREEIARINREKEKNFLTQFMKEARVKEIAYIYKKGSGFTIYTTHPGYLIGKGGILIDKYKKILKKEFSPSDDIKIIDIFWGGFITL